LPGKLIILPGLGSESGLGLELGSAYPNTRLPGERFKRGDLTVLYVRFATLAFELNKKTRQISGDEIKTCPVFSLSILFLYYNYN
jgi:hypothetical protein